MADDHVLLVVCTLIIGGLIWWFGLKVIERLDMIIRMRGGEPPK